MATDKEFADKVREIIAEYTTAFKAFGDDIIAAVKFEMEKGMDIRDAVQKVLEDLDFDSHNTELVAAAVVASAIAGFGLRPEQVTPEAKAEIKKVLMKKPWSADGMKLSERLHGVDKVLRQNIISTVTASVNNSDSVIDMARKLYDGYNSGKAVIKPADLPEYLKKLVRQARLAMQGDVAELSKLGILQSAQKLKNPDRLTTKALKRAYKDLVEACAKLDSAAIDKALWVAVQEKSRYYAERIARTESARAWYEGYLAECESEGDVVGHRYTLSSAHKTKPYDICDVYANADFGYGKGIFPHGKQPDIPVHPHCMCYYGKIFEGDLKGEWKPEKAREYINSRSAVQKQILFGRDGAARYNAGEDWQKLVKSNEKYSNRVKKLKEILKNGIITNVKDGNMPEIDIIIDELTPCLKDNKTGEILETAFAPIKISKTKALSMMKKGWKFDWSKPAKNGYSIFQLNLKGSKEVEGLIALKSNEGFTEIDIVETAPANFGKNGRYKGVGAHLFVIACQHSFDNGNDGYVAFTAKSNLVEYYKKLLNAQLISEQKMFIDTEAALKLLKIYNFEKEG